MIKKMQECSKKGLYYEEVSYATFTRYHLLASKYYYY